MNVRQSISEGKNMAEPLAATGVFPDMVVQMIAVGEQTGALDQMLNKIADFYEEETDVAVAALGTVYAVGGDDEAGTALGGLLAGKWSLATALSFLAWYVFAPQCAATLGVVKRETNGWTWPTVMFLYMTGLAYLASFTTYHVAVALGAG